MSLRRHTLHCDWDGTVYTRGTLYPCAPGHEIVGKVHCVGADPYAEVTA